MIHAAAVSIPINQDAQTDVCITGIHRYYNLVRYGCIQRSLCALLAPAHVSAYLGKKGFLNQTSFL